MLLDIPTILTLAMLARINVLEEERYMFASEVASILYWIKQLQTIDTEGIEPMITTATMHLHSRDDIVNDTADINYILANAQESSEDFFLVPKLVE